MMGPRHSPDNSDKPLSPLELKKIDAYWRAADYLSVGQIYLLDNPLLQVPLVESHLKPRLLGHWEATSGLNFVYAHLNRLIKERSLNAIFVTGPDRAGPGLIANAYLEGTYSEYYPAVTQDTDGMKRLFKQFSFPGGVSGHVAPETPGSIHQGDEIGDALSHAFGAAFDQPGLLVCCLIGDSEAETAPGAANWHSNKFLNPKFDGAVLPILHLNGGPVDSPTLLATLPQDELESLMIGYGYKPYFLTTNDPGSMHQEMATALSRAVDEISSLQSQARSSIAATRPQWPMIVLRTPKGWTGPLDLVHLYHKSSWLPVANVLNEYAPPDYVRILEAWLLAYRPSELFDSNGRILAEIADVAPAGPLRMSANPVANGGAGISNLRLPQFRYFSVPVPVPGMVRNSSTEVLSKYIRRILLINRNLGTFRLFGVDGITTSHLGGLLEATNNQWYSPTLLDSEHSPEAGRVMEILSTHTSQGWLEGYLLTGRHGLFLCYEAFARIIDPMFRQHARWLKMTSRVPWQKPISSMNFLLTSHIWRPDHNGSSHQDPGFVDHVVTSKSDFVRLYLPPDANTLLAVIDECLRSRQRMNIIVTGKHPELQYLAMADAINHCRAGIGIWDWASNDQGDEPDVVMACAGDIPTLEVLASVDLLRKHCPEINIRVVNVVDLLTLQSPAECACGLSDKDFDSIFTTDKPIIFAYHGYPSLIHRLTHRRTNHANLHVRGYQDEGGTTTPFDTLVMNQMDRFHLAIDVIDNLPNFTSRAAYFKQFLRDKLIEHTLYIREFGEDLPEISSWSWPY